MDTDHHQIICLSDIFISPLEDMYVLALALIAKRVPTNCEATSSRSFWEPTSTDF